MLELTPTRALSWSYRVTENGNDVSLLELARFKSAGSFTFEDRTFDLKRERILGPLALREADRTIARVQRTGLIPPRFIVSADDRQLTLSGSGLFGGRVRIVHGDVVIGSIRRPKFFRRAVTVDAMQVVPVPLLIFCAAVVILQWRKASRSSG